MKPPLRFNPRPNDGCCHSCALDDADGEHVADFAEEADARAILALVNAQFNSMPAEVTA